MPKIVDFKSRRRDIAAKAVSVFVKDGFAEANLSKIAGLCGFGRTTIYKYFKNKEEIFSFALDEIFSRVEREFGDIADNGELDATEKLTRLLGVLARTSVDDRERMTLVMDLLLDRGLSGLASGGGEVLERVRSLRSVFEKVLEAGMAKGELRTVKAYPMASILFSIVEAFVIQSSLFGSLSYADAMEGAAILLDGLRSR